MRRILAALVRALLLLLLAVLLGFAVLVWQVDALGRQDHARPSDVIVVLGARVDADGQPGSDLTSRTYRAVDLWQEGYAPAIICTGGFRDEPLSAASVCRRFATQLGVPADRVIPADGSSNTIEDAAVTAEVMAERGWRDAVLVSHPLHLFRARWLFHRAGIDAVTSPTSTDTARIFFPLRLWYASREAAAVVVTAANAWDLVPGEWIVRLQQWVYRLQ
jgi:uncharacterized SAM-binding protein YcdF (DUF218 family)